MENNNFQGIQKYLNNSTTTKKNSSFSQSNCSAWKSLTKLGFFGKVLAGLNYLHFCTGVNFFRSLSYSRWLLNPNSIFWRNFVYQALATSFNFPAKKLRKIRALKIRMRHFFFVSIGCSKWSNFPAKRLRKIRAPKIRMRRFFFFLRWILFH